MIKNLITGFAYAQNAQGKIVYKFDLPVGPHEFDDSLEIFQVPDRTALDSIVLHKEPPSENYVNNGKISREIRKENRKLAIARLKAKGELPPTYTDTEL